MSLYVPGSLVPLGVIMFMFVVLVAALVSAGAWALGRSGVLGGTAPERAVIPPPEPEDEALDIIRRRYALGEITRDEFEQMYHELAS
ncbi:MAG: SHOCT domain-containing protein [Anaerolineae bacterium]